MSSINSISTLSLPADIRAAGTDAVKDYKTAVGFEQMLAGQLVKRELWDGTSEVFEHDALGDIVRLEGPAGELRFERDALGRILREAQVVSDEEHIVESAYEPGGGRVWRKTSLGHTEAIERNALRTRQRKMTRDPPERCTKRSAATWNQ